MLRAPLARSWQLLRSPVLRVSPWLLALALAGCPPRADQADTTLRSLAQALRRGDASAAYALMSQSYREQVPLSELERLMREQPEEIRATAEALEQPLAIEEEARARLPNGEIVVLARDDGAWRVVTDVSDYYGQRTPRAAVRSFVRAVEHRRYDVVLALLPEAERSRWNAETLRTQWEGPAREELERLVTALRGALETAPIEQTGDRATMPYGDRFRVVLVREANRWHIEDPE